MKRSLLSFFCCLLVIMMVIPALSSCTHNSGFEDTTASDATESETSSEREDDTANTEDTAQSETSSEREDDTANTEDTAQSETEETEPRLEGEHAELIENADSLKNNVTAYYANGKRENVIFENMEMLLDYSLLSGSDQLVSTLTNKKGNEYISNTMDVFVRMADGNVYYASDSSTNAVFNIHRFGYYFYQMRAEGQNFIGGLEVKSELNVSIEKPTSTAYIDGYKYRKGDGYAIVRNADPAKDPRIVFGDLEVSTDKYTVLEITMRAEEQCSANADLFFVAGSYTGLNSSQRLRFQLTTDGEWHTYRIPVYTGSDYTGTLSRIAMDINGSGARYDIKEIKFLEIDIENAPSDLSLCRTFNIYADKMHHVIQIAATAETSGIKEIGMRTEIAADKVVKLVCKDAAGLHYSLDEVDWNTAEYVGFDIADAGIFGYILPFDGKGGAIKVELVGSKYVIEQTMSPTDGTIKPSRLDYDEKNQYYNWVPGGNSNDLFMGQRIYTDDSHDFTTFLEEAYCERNPLPDSRFKIIDTGSTSATYLGYDSLRGIYRFGIGGATGFNTPFYTDPNKHYRANFYVKGDDHLRKIYAMTYHSSGQLECAVLLDEKDVMLPVPMEVGKNFAESGGADKNLYDLSDAAYSETIFPLVIDPNTKYEYTVVNLYQNWGNYPLKQISWIKFFSPYYHLSTGVTETNCILPWTFTNQIWYNTLPDFRGMSAPHWEDEPQHTSAGDHDWLKYTDSDGNVVRAENVMNVIDSHGPTYASVKMDYVTYDGKIKVSYTHTEMPQTDENRTYYEIRYEVLGDVTINDVVNNLQLYKVNPNDSTGKYKRVGYLNTDGESVVVDANETTTPVKYVLGDNCPYFSFFDMDNHENEKGYGNLAFLVYNSEFIIGGEKAEPSFAIVNHTDTVYVTLDLETLTLKAGDSITINCILLPWGSQQLDDGIDDPENGNYEYTSILPDKSQYMDKNVRDVRENSLLNPLHTVAGKDAAVIDSVFLPKVKTTNGESCEFTLKGGFNNVAVRVYGFEKMSVPTIYEKIGDEWQIYNVSSSKSENYPHKYDGYSIHYDGDGTFSYSFVTDMDGKNDRTFRIVVDGNHKKWGAESFEVDIGREDLLNIYTDHVELAGLVGKTQISKSEVFEEEGYVRFFGAGEDATLGEAYVNVHKNANPTKDSGKYIAVKYRIPTTNTKTIGRFDILISTAATIAPSDGTVQYKDVKNDGEWHTFIIDLEKVERESFKSHFMADASGKYYPLVIRFDFFDKKMSTDSYIDLAFVGMDDSLADILKLSQDCKDITLVEGSEISPIDHTTGEKIDSTTLNIYTDYVKLAELVGETQISKSELFEKDGYVRFFGAGPDSTKTEAFVFAYKDATSTTASGKYIAVKYRIPTTNTEKIERFDILINTASTTPSSDGTANYYDVKNDGEWHTFIIDLEKVEREGFSSYFTANANGKYYPLVIRFDFFDKKMSTDSYIDLTFVGMDDSLAKIASYSLDCKDITLVEGSDTFLIDPTTGEKIDIATLNIYTDHVKLAESVGKTQISKSELYEEDGYVRFFGAGPTATLSEAYVFAYKDANSTKASGKYIAVKYRIPTTNAETIGRFDILINTASTTPDGNGTANYNGVKNDGEWHTFIIDLEKVEREGFSSCFEANANGKYYPLVIRFDFFDKKMSTDSYIDLAFLGMDDSLAKIASYSLDCKDITLVEGSAISQIDPVTGEKIDLTVKIPEVLVDPTSGYTKSSLEYGAQMDYINGVLVSTTGGSKKGVAGIMHNASTIADRSVTDCATVEGYNLVFGGWCVVEGGVDHYVWSADGGVTWHETVDFGKSTSSASANNISAAKTRSNQAYEFTLEADGANGSFSGTAGNNPKGIAADLEAYKGQTVDVILGAVPAKDTSTILPLYYISRVKVAE